MIVHFEGIAFQIDFKHTVPQVKKRRGKVIRRTTGSTTCYIHRKLPASPHDPNPQWDLFVSSTVKQYIGDEFSKEEGRLRSLDEALRSATKSGLLGPDKGRAREIRSKIWGAYHRAKLPRMDEEHVRGLARKFRNNLFSMGAEWSSVQRGFIQDILGIPWIRPQTRFDEAFQLTARYIADVLLNVRDAQGQGAAPRKLGVSRALGMLCQYFGPQIVERKPVQEPPEAIKREEANEVPPAGPILTNDPEALSRLQEMGVPVVDMTANGDEEDSRVDPNTWTLTERLRVLDSSVPRGLLNEIREMEEDHQKLSDMRDRLQAMLGN